MPNPPLDRFAQLDEVSVEKVLIEARRRFNPAFTRIRNHVCDGYVMHPRWRDSGGREIWAPIGFRPVLCAADQLAPESDN